jgi:TonB family protein
VSTLFATGMLGAALCIFAVPSAKAQQSTENTTITDSVTSYPDSPEGLKALMGNIFAALGARNGARVSELLDNFAIPDYQAWFVKEFGSAEGQRLALKYGELAPQSRFQIEKLFNSALSEGRTDVTVTALQRPLDSSIAGLGRAVVESMQAPITLYSADGRSPNEPYPLFLGHYFYLQGGFRYINDQVLQALSTAPPPRIRLGGQVVAAKLLHQPQPTYPSEARRSRIEGSVILHAIIGTDGHVKELNLVSGDPILADAAISAVRQWQYQPTKLNNVPAEVDTTITVTFQMR